MITTLGGGVGAAKFLEGLSSIIADEPLKVVVNTADDIFLNGLKISPDVDTIIYRLSGNVDVKKGWGLDGDTFNCLDAHKRFGLESWFNLGDRDIATHLFRTYLHNLGHSATEITSKIAQAYGLKRNITILPMTDQHVETWIKTDIGEIHFQEYLVKHRMSPRVEDVIIKGSGEAKPAPGIIDSIRESAVIVICPSNPIISIGPILKIEGIGEALSQSEGKKIAVSPLIGGKPLRGPADKLMKLLDLRSVPLR